MPFIGKKIVQNQVTGTDIVDGTLVAADIADGAVSTAKLAADAVDGTKLADNAVNSEHYTDGSIDTAHVADGNITTAKVADDAVTQAKIAADAVGTNELANDVTISTSGAISTSNNLTVRNSSTTGATINVGTTSTSVANGGYIGGILFDASTANSAVARIQVLSNGQTDAGNTGTGADFSFECRDNNQSFTEKFRITGDGKVGIGINDPSHQLHIESSGSNTYATRKLEGQNRGGQIDMFQNTLITNQILGDQSGNLYFGSSGGFGQVAIDSQAFMSATNKAFGFRTSTFITTMADDTIKTIVTNGSGLIIVSSYTYGRVAIYKHDYIGGTTLMVGDTLYYATTNTDGKYSVESGSNSYTAQLRNRFGGNADFKVMFIGTYQ